jgi:hypothetical protein
MDAPGIVLEISPSRVKASDGERWNQLLRVKLVTGDERWIGSWDPVIVSTDDNLTQEDMDELNEFLNNRCSK